MNKDIIVFVDSDAFVALTKKDDSNHEKAIDIFQKLQDRKITFITSNYVFSEVVTILSQRVDHKTAIAFIESVKSEENIFMIERVDSQIEERAIGIFIEQASKNVSFVDCTNIALIRQKHLDSIFSFDKIYKKNSIQVIENLL